MTKELELIATAVNCPRAGKNEAVTLASCQDCEYFVKKGVDKKRRGEIIKETPYVLCLIPTKVIIFTVNNVKAGEGNGVD